MSTPISEIKEVIDMLKEEGDTFQDTTVEDKFAKYGVIQASIDLGEDWDIVEEDDGQGGTIQVVNTDLTTKQKYLCGLHGFRNFAMKKHSEFTNKATNFKTINFAVSGLTERAKEAMRIVWWCDEEIKRVVTELAPLVGSSQMMVGDE